MSVKLKIDVFTHIKIYRKFFKITNATFKQYLWKSLFSYATINCFQTIVVSFLLPLHLDFPQQILSNVGECSTLDIDYLLYRMKNANHIYANISTLNIIFNSDSYLAIVEVFNGYFTLFHPTNLTIIRRISLGAFNAVPRAIAFHSDASFIRTDSKMFVIVDI